MNSKKAKKLRRETTLGRSVYVRNCEAVFYSQTPASTHDPFRGLLANVNAMTPYFMGYSFSGRENIGKKAYNEAKKNLSRN